jgi:hypothetical protein
VGIKKKEELRIHMATENHDKQGDVLTVSAEKESLSPLSYGHHTSERACCTISTRTFLVSAWLLTSRKNAMRAPRIPACVFTRT